MNEAFEVKDIYAYAVEDIEQEHPIILMEDGEMLVSEIQPTGLLYVLELEGGYNGI